MIFIIAWGCLLVWGLVQVAKHSAKQQKAAERAAVIRRVQTEENREREAAKARAAEEKATMQAAKIRAAEEKQAEKEAAALRKSNHTVQRAKSEIYYLSSMMDTYKFERDQIDEKLVDLYKAAERSSNEKLARQISALENKANALDAKIHSTEMKMEEYGFKYREAMRTARRLGGCV